MIRLAFRVRPADAEVVLAELMELAPTGVEETDLGDTIEYAVYGAEGELPSLPAVRALVGDALVEVVSTEVADDWADRWRAFHEPILIKDRLYVRPPWCPPYAEVVAGEDTGIGAADTDGAGRSETGGPADAGVGGPSGAAGAPDAGGAGPSGPVASVTDLVVDPGQAFGTGAHATTRLCLELLVELTDRRREAGEDLGPVLDLGSGSGVLAVAAAQLGWGPVHGVDHEAASVAATLENAAVNGVTVTADRFDLLRDGATAMPEADDLAATSGGVDRRAVAAGIAEGRRTASGDAKVRATASGDAEARATASGDAEGRATASGDAERRAAVSGDAKVRATPSGGAGHAAPAAPLVLANILRPLLLRVAADGFLGTPPHHLIASGLLVHECDGVAAAFARIGLVEAERRSHGDWAALLLRRA